MERNFLIKLAYDGAAYHGWQIQENALTVQQVFQEALGKITGLSEDIKACSRTDTGVHARQFCVSLKTESPIAPERLLAALNHYLPQDVAVRSVEQVPLDFHARYSCKGKEYVYQIWNHPVRDPFLKDRALHYWYPIDEALLDRAAGHYVGRHDFSSFCTLDKRERGDLTRTVTKAQVRRQGDLVTFTVAADGVLYNMVRILAGELYAVGRGLSGPDDICAAFATGERSKLWRTLPAVGLTLEHVDYGFPLFGEQSV